MDELKNLAGKLRSSDRNLLCHKVPRDGTGFAILLDFENTILWTDYRFCQMVGKFPDCVIGQNLSEFKGLPPIFTLTGQTCRRSSRRTLDTTPEWWPSWTSESAIRIDKLPMYDKHQEQLGILIVAVDMRSIKNIDAFEAWEREVKFRSASYDIEEFLNRCKEA